MYRCKVATIYRLLFVLLVNLKLQTMRSVLSLVLPGNVKLEILREVLENGSLFSPIVFHTGCSYLLFCRRQRTKRVHAMECRPSTSDVPRSTPLQGTSSFFVKEFSRSSAGRKIKPSDVRPLPVLSRTLRYLLTV